MLKKDFGRKKKVRKSKIKKTKKNQTHFSFLDCKHEKLGNYYYYLSLSLTFLFYPICIACCHVYNVWHVCALKLFQCWLQFYDARRSLPLL